MQYKVQTATLDKDGVFDVISGWVEADGLCGAAVLFMLEQPIANTLDRKYLDPILVVDKNYNMGNYNHEGVNVAMDYEVGLRV